MLEDTKEQREQAETERSELKTLLSSNRGTLRVMDRTLYHVIEKGWFMK